MGADAGVSVVDSPEFIMKNGTPARSVGINTSATALIDASGAETCREPYNGEKDFAGSLLVAYAAIRERMAAGGPAWDPKHEQSLCTIHRKQDYPRARAGTNESPGTGESPISVPKDLR
jgi:hypothetical protein